jgi:hypothetical protein
MTSSEKPVDEGVLAVWKARYAALGRLIEVYEEAERIGALGGAFDPTDLPTLSLTGHAPKVVIGLPVGVFRDKSLREAIPIYLGAGRRKQTNKEIAIGLQDGGFPTTADNFEATVATALYRLKNDGVLLRFPDGWDLASSYPDNLRGRLEKDSKPRKPLRAKRVKRGKDRSDSANHGSQKLTLKVPRRLTVRRAEDDNSEAAG